jgi:hypothetical protein
MVKDAEFKRYLSELLNGNDTVSIPYAYTMDNSVYTNTLNTNTLNTNTLNANTLNTETLNAETQNTKSVKKSKYENPQTENPSIENPQVENPPMDDPQMENPSVENELLLNTDESITDKSNTKKVNTKRVNTKDIDVYFPLDEKLNESFKDYIEYRKSIRKPLKGKGVELAIKKLDSLTADNDIKIEIINQSIMNGWTGLFPLKSDNKNPVKDKLNDSYDLINQWVHEREAQE